MSQDSTQCGSATATTKNKESATPSTLSEGFWLVWFGGSNGLLIPADTPELLHKLIGKGHCVKTDYSGDPEKIVSTLSQMKKSDFRISYVSESLYRELVANGVLESE